MHIFIEIRAPSPRFRRCYNRAHITRKIRKQREISASTQPCRTLEAPAQQGRENRRPNSSGRNRDFRPTGLREVFVKADCRSRRGQGAQHLPTLWQQRVTLSGSHKPDAKQLLVPDGKVDKLHRAIRTHHPARPNHRLLRRQPKRRPPDSTGNQQPLRRTRPGSPILVRATVPQGRNTG